MLDRLFDALKLAAWGTVAGACVVASIVVNRVPHSDLGVGPNHEADTLVRQCSFQGHDATTMCIATAECDIGQAQCATYCADNLPDPLTVQADFVADGDFLPVDCSGSSDCQQVCAVAQIDRTIDDDTSDTSFNGQNEFTADMAPEAALDGSSMVTYHEELPLEPLAEQSNSSAEMQAAAETVGATWPHVACQDAGSQRQLTMRDAVSNQPVATLTMSDTVLSGTISNKELEEAAVERANIRRARLHQTAGMGRTTGRQQVNVFRDPNSGHLTIDTQTIEISELANQLSTRCGRPVVCHESAFGSVSARATDVTLVRAVRRIVEPFGFSVLENGDEIVIGEAMVMNQLARQSATPDPHVGAPIVNQENQVTRDNVNSTHQVASNARRLPPVVDGSEVSQVSFQATRTIPQDTGAEPHEIAIGRRAKALISKDLLVETADLLQTAVKQYPDSAILYRMLAEVSFSRKEFTDARAAAERSLQLDKNNPLTNQIYGDILLRFGETARSEHYIQQAKYLKVSRRN